MSAHTPGPWKCHEDFVSATNPYSSIAKCYAKDSFSNAQLIAAAPEMFEVLKQISQQRGFCESAPFTSEQIETLIQKIEGEK